MFKRKFTAGVPACGKIQIFRTRRQFTPLYGTQGSMMGPWPAYKALLCCRVSTGCQQAQIHTLAVRTSTRAQSPHGIPRGCIDPMRLCTAWRDAKKKETPASANYVAFHAIPKRPHGGALNASRDLWQSLKPTRTSCPPLGTHGSPK